MLTTSLASTTTSRISTVRAIAIILAHGVLRLHQRQNDIDNSTEQSVQNKAGSQMLLRDAMKSKTLRGEPHVLDA
jgi:hypothetical protein